MEAETDAGFIQREVAKISIHSARVGGDHRCFYDLQHGRISIHSARVGGDVALRRNRRLLLHFNPLRPCGRRPEWADEYRRLSSISIHSARVGGDHLHEGLHQIVPLISIHSARVGGDRMSIGISFLQSNFNPLRPCGRRRE